MHFAGEGGCYGVLPDGKLRLFLLAEAPTFLSFFAFSGWGSLYKPDQVSAAESVLTDL
jgi:hypothetical protein